MRIAIVGAGAIGGWMAARLKDDGHDVSIFARGETLAQLRRNGLSLSEGGRTRSVSIPASDRPQELGAQDLVVIAVKAPAMAQVATVVPPLLARATIVLPALNGVPWWFGEGLGPPLAGTTLQTIDPDGAIGRNIPASHVIGCVVHASAMRQAPAAVVHTIGNRLIVGEPMGGDSTRLSALAQMLGSAGFDVEASPRIQRDVWYKLWGNMTMNPISAMTGATTGEILDDDLVRTFALRIMAEAAAIGARIGCPIAESGEDRMRVTRRLGGIKTSMLQDVEAGRPLELEALLGAPREIARLVGVPTPEMDALYGLMRLFAAGRRLSGP